MIKFNFSSSESKHESISQILLKVIYQGNFGSSHLSLEVASYHLLFVWLFKFILSYLFSSSMRSYLYSILL